MTIKDDVQAAFQKLDPKDDAIWNRDGTPKLEAIRNAAGDQKIRREEVADALGDQRRPAQEQTPPPEQAPPEPQAPPPEQAPTPPADAGAGVQGVDPDAGKPDEVYTAKAEVPGVVDTETPSHSTLASELQGHIDAIEAQLGEAGEAKTRATALVNELQAAKDRLNAQLDKHTVHLTHAEAVKRVQAQTVANLAGGKAKMQAVAAVMGVQGIAVPASKLDAAYLARKRSPEQAANAAAFHHQRAQERLGERLGTP